MKWICSRIAPLEHNRLWISANFCSSKDDGGVAVLDRLLAFVARQNGSYLLDCWSIVAPLVDRKWRSRRNRHASNWGMKQCPLIHKEERPKLLDKRVVVAQPIIHHQHRLSQASARNCIKTPETLVSCSLAIKDEKLSEIGLIRISCFQDTWHREVR